MKNEIVFETIVERIKLALDVKNDKDLAARLGLKPNTFYNRRKSRSLPVDEIIRLADANQMSLDWIFFGIGKPFRNPSIDLKPIATVDGNLFGEIFMALRRRFFGETPIDASKESLEKLALLHIVSSEIYNQVAFIKEPVDRSEKVQELARDFHFAQRALELVSAKNSTAKSVDPRNL